MKLWLASLVGLGAGLWTHSPELTFPQTSPPPPKYSEVGQIFRQRCMPCHSEKRKAWGMDLSSYKGLMAGSNNGEVVKAGDPMKSQLVVVIKDTKGLRMPKSGRSLTTKQIATIEAWIAAGAKPD